jgi:1-acyl-sn-glycerol-3-phosphate acyltransferase
MIHAAFHVVFRALVRLLLRVFFRDVRVTGLEALATDRPVLLVGNHVNGPLDPLLLLAATPRRLTLTAKAGLTNDPLLRVLLRGLDAVLFHRREDGDEGAVAANEAALARCARVLGGGGAIVLFPEGRSHSEPRLLAFKTGAARVAVAARAAGRAPVVVPFGLAFRDKARLRTEVRVALGAPIDVDACLAAARGADPARALTAAFRAAVERAVAESAFSPAPPAAPERPVRDLLRAIDTLVLGAPWFAFGVVTHALPAVAIAWLERRLATDLDHHAPCRFYAAMVIVPASYALQIAAVVALAGAAWGALFAAALPLAGLYAAAYSDALRDAFACLGALTPTRKPPALPE